jgi:hypothetical protein
VKSFCGLIGPEQRGQGHREGPFEEQVPRDTGILTNIMYLGSPPHRRNFATRITSDLVVRLVQYRQRQ